MGKSVVTNGRQFKVQNLDQVYVMASSTHKTTRRDLYSVESDVKPQINRYIWVIETGALAVNIVNVEIQVL